MARVLVGLVAAVVLQAALASQVDELRSLWELHLDGGIDAEEYALAKKTLLSHGAGAAPGVQQNDGALHAILEDLGLSEDLGL